MIVCSVFGRKRCVRAGMSQTIELIFADVFDIDHRLLGKKCETFHQLLFVFADFHFAQRLFRFQPGFRALQICELLLERRILQFLQILFEPFHALFDRSDVGEHQFIIEIAFVAFRIDRAFGMRHRFVFKRADHVNQRIDRPHRRQRHVLALCRARVPEHRRIRRSRMSSFPD